MNNIGKKFKLNQNPSYGLGSYAHHNLKILNTSRDSIYSQILLVSRIRYRGWWADSSPKKPNRVQVGSSIRWLFTSMAEGSSLNPLEPTNAILVIGPSRLVLQSFLQNTGWHPRTPTQSDQMIVGRPTIGSFIMALNILVKYD